MQESETEWWDVLHAREPTLSHPYVLGMMGWIARVGVCGAGCACLEERETEENLQTGLARIGYRAVTPMTVPPTVRQLPQKGLRSQRELAALLDWTACALRPPQESVCLHEKQATSGMGLAAYPIWSIAFEQVRGSEQATLRKRAARWGEWKRTGSDFLRELAGKQRTPYALRLLRAADLLEEEADVWTALSSSGAMGNARSEVEKAARLAQSAAGYIAEATFLTMRLASVVQNTLQDLFVSAIPTPLVGVTLQEMVYLARTGTPPLRLLAARRLAGTDEPASISALSQLLFDTDTPTAETALWALQQMPHSLGGRFVPLFIHVFRTLEAEPEGASFPLRHSLLQALSDAPGEAAKAFLAEVEGDEGVKRRQDDRMTR